MPELYKSNTQTIQIYKVKKVEPNKKMPDKLPGTKILLFSKLKNFMEISKNTLQRYNSIIPKAQKHVNKKQATPRPRKTATVYLKDIEKRANAWGKVYPNDLKIEMKKLNPTQKLIVLLLRVWTGKRTYCFSWHSTIANHLGLERTTILRNIRDLQRLGYLKVKKDTGKSNRYQVKKYPAE